MKPALRGRTLSPSLGLGGFGSPSQLIEKMRKRKEIEKDGTKKDTLILEVLLDIRELLVKERKRTIKSNKK